MNVLNEKETDLRSMSFKILSQIKGLSINLFLKLIIVVRGGLCDCWPKKLATPLHL
jgi:hypothetical protein